MVGCEQRDSLPFYLFEDSSGHIAFSAIDDEFSRKVEILFGEYVENRNQAMFPQKLSGFTAYGEYRHEEKPKKYIIVPELNLQVLMKSESRENLDALEKRIFLEKRH